MLENLADTSAAVREIRSARPRQLYKSRLLRDKFTTAQPAQDNLYSSLCVHLCPLWWM